MLFCLSKSIIRESLEFSSFCTFRGLIYYSYSGDGRILGCNREKFCTSFSIFLVLGFLRNSSFSKYGDPHL